MDQSVAQFGSQLVRRRLDHERRCEGGVDRVGQIGDDRLDETLQPSLAAERRWRGFEHEAGKPVGASMATRRMTRHELDAPPELLVRCPRRRAGPPHERPSSRPGSRSPACPSHRGREERQRWRVSTGEAGREWVGRTTGNPSRPAAGPTRAPTGPLCGVRQAQPAFER